MFLVGLAVAMEYVDPLPFSKSVGAWFIWAALLFEILRQFVRFYMETSVPAVIRAEAVKSRWTDRKDALDENVRFRIRRFVTVLAGLWVYGSLISLFTDRCDGAFQCSLLSVSLFVENIPTIIQILIGISFGILQLGFMFIALTKVGFVKIVPPGTIDVEFSDVYGQDRARDRVQEQVGLLEDDDEVEESGGYMPKGVLLTGPPGTGKTMLAKAAANASTKPLILIPPGAFASTFMGINFLKVWQLGKYIRKHSKRHGGVIIFFDEIDVLGHRGGEIEGTIDPWYVLDDEGCMSNEPHPVINMNGGGGMNQGTLEAFLAMMDGMEEPRGFVNKILALAGFKALPPPKVRAFYLGATNRPSAVDPALKRAGRFGREIRVDFPKYEGRRATYEGYLSKVSHNLEDENIGWAARNHHKGTGAEIQEIVNEALLISFRGDEGGGIVSFQNLVDAMLWKRFGESDGTFENEKNVYSVAIHEAGHALIMHVLRRERKHIWFVSIEQRGRTGGMVAPSPMDDDWKQQHDEMLGDVAVSLGSRVAEILVNGQVSNGHGGDGPAATRLAANMVTLGHTFNPEDKTGQLSATTEREPEKFHELRETILVEAYQLAEDVLGRNRDALLALADLLVEEKTVIGDKVHQLLEDHNAE
jgi:cell division protease FtsH